MCAHALGCARTCRASAVAPLAGGHAPRRGPHGTRAQPERLRPALRHRSIDARPRRPLRAAPPRPVLNSTVEPVGTAARALMPARARSRTGARAKKNVDSFGTPRVVSKRETAPVLNRGRHRMCCNRWLLRTTDQDPVSNFHHCHLGSSCDEHPGSGRMVTTRTAN